MRLIGVSIRRIIVGGEESVIQGGGISSGENVNVSVDDWPA